jgi:hypothetical protein
MAKKIKKSDFIKVMIHLLESFNDEGIEINENTIHHEVLNDNDGFGAGNSKNLYKGAIDWTLWRNKFKPQSWPDTWMDMSVTDLCNVLLK